MISDDEILHSLSIAIDLMDQKEYTGGKKIIRNVRNKIQKKVDEQKRQERKKISQAEAIIRESKKEHKDD